MSLRKRSFITPRLILGLSLIFVGVVFFLDRLGEVHADDILEYWPVILVLAGLSKLFWPGGHGGRFTGFLLVLIGAWILAWNLYWIDYSPWDFWPILLVVVGLRIAWLGVVSPIRRQHADEASVVNSVAILGATRRTSHSSDFRGGDVAAFLGGCEIDLRGARIADPPAVIDAFVMWGGIEIVVPRTWHVVVNGIPLLAGFEDKTVDPGEDDLAPGEPRQELVVKGFAIMGGVEVKN
jgi:hypothetical protein